MSFPMQRVFFFLNIDKCQLKRWSNKYRINFRETISLIYLEKKNVKTPKKICVFIYYNVFTSLRYI